MKAPINWHNWITISPIFHIVEQSNSSPKRPREMDCSTKRGGEHSRSFNLFFIKCFVFYCIVTFKYKTINSQSESNSEYCPNQNYCNFPLVNHGVGFAPVQRSNPEGHGKWTFPQKGGDTVKALIYFYKIIIIIMQDFRY